MYAKTAYTVKCLSHQGRSFDFSHDRLDEKGNTKTSRTDLLYGLKSLMLFCNPLLHMVTKKPSIRVMLMNRAKDPGAILGLLHDPLATIEAFFGRTGETISCPCQRVR